MGPLNFPLSCTGTLIYSYLLYVKKKKIPPQSRIMFTSSVGCCSDIHSCKHLAPLRGDAGKARKERRREKRVTVPKSPGANVVFFLLRGPWADVLTHPHKEPLMSAQPTKNTSTHKRALLLSTLAPRAPPPAKRAG